MKTPIMDEDDAHLNPKAFNIDRTELFRLYMDHIMQTYDDCEWVVNVTPQMVVNTVAHVLEQNPGLIK